MSSSEAESEESSDDEKKQAGQPQFEPYSSLHEDVAGSSASEDSEDLETLLKKAHKKRRKKKKRKATLPPGGFHRTGMQKEEEDKSDSPYLEFDFRRGASRWPEGVEMVNAEKAAELLHKTKQALLDRDRESSDRKAPAKAAPVSSASLKAPPEAEFELLKDGSTALVIPPNTRLKFDLTDLINGRWEERKHNKPSKPKQKGKAHGRSRLGTLLGFGSEDFDMMSAWGFGSSTSVKDYINEYTIVCDIKLLAAPEQGMSLFQTGLAHSSEETNSKGGVRISTSEGECLINRAGGLGMFGKFGDVSKHKVSTGKWHRLVISVVAAEKGKGVYRAFLDTHPMGTAQKELISANGRFALDPEHLFMFSSSKEELMPGKVALRYVRVVANWAWLEKDVVENRAVSKVVSMFTEQQQQQEEHQHKGLSLKALFNKPRPVWLAPTMVALFGDAYIEGTMFEGASCLAWSFAVLNHALQQLGRTAPQQRLFLSCLPSEQSAALTDVCHVFAESANIFTLFARLLKHPNNTQLISFLRKLHTQLAGLGVGSSLVLPLLIEEKEEMLIILQRNTHTWFRVALVHTNPLAGLQYHNVSNRSPPKLKFRTVLVLEQVSKKAVLDDVFWLAAYNLAIHKHSGDVERFYEILLPFLTGKPLDTSLVEAEAAASKQQTGSYGYWRSVQRSNTSYVRCLIHGLTYLLRTSGFSKLQAKRVMLALRFEFAKMIHQDMTCVYPDTNGQKVCDLACSQLSYCTAKLANILDQAKRAGLAEELLDFDEMETVRIFVDETREKLSICAKQSVTLPPRLSLTLPTGPADPGESSAARDAVTNRAVRPTVMGEALKREHTQFWHALAWNLENVNADPGQASFLHKYVALDMLQMSARAKTRDEAVHALRITERLCTLLENQAHCIKNRQQLIVSLMVHVLTRVVPVPKPRGLAGQAQTAGSKVAAIQRRIQRRERREKRREKEREAEKKRRAEAKQMKLQGLPELADSKAETVQVESESAESLQQESGGFSGMDELKQPLPVPALPLCPSVVDGLACAFEHNALHTEKYRHDEAPKLRKRTDAIAEEGEEDEQADDKEKKTERDEDTPDFSVGDKMEETSVKAHCIWDQPIKYALQVELMLELQRLSEHFASKVLSLHQCRELDAVCMIIPGVIAAIADAVMRKRAVDLPSEACTHLMGQLRDGKQLGIPGFGLTCSTFQTQIETTEIHNMELSVARTAVLDYFQSPEQRALEKIFVWEANYYLKPEKTLIRYIRNICRELAASVPMPHLEMQDQRGNSPAFLLKSYPELKAYRDVAFWWKYFLNPDLSMFPNSIGKNRPALGYLLRQDVEFSFNWNHSRNCYQVYSNRCGELFCRPNPHKVSKKTGKRVKNLPTHRYPSTARPSIHLKGMTIKTEDDLLHCPNLPNFAPDPPKNLTDQEAKAGLDGLSPADVDFNTVARPKQAETNTYVLGQRDSELLLSYLTVPYMRLPLVLSFFATEDRVHKLASTKLRRILDACIFEPGRYLSVKSTGVCPVLVPTPNKELLATPYGPLCNELQKSPDTVFHALAVLLDAALALDTGSVCDNEVMDFNPGVDIILYTTRLAARVMNFISFLVEYAEQGQDVCTNGPLRGMDLTQHAIARLKAGQEALRQKLQRDIYTLLCDYLSRLTTEVEANPTAELIINRNSHLSADLHAHILLLFRNEATMTVTSAQSILCSFVYLTTRYTFGQFTRRQGRILISDLELYDILNKQRTQLILFANTLGQTTLDKVMQQVLAASSSATGYLRSSSELLDSKNRWAHIAGPRNVGRYAVDSSRSETVHGQATDGPISMSRQVTEESQEVGYVKDTGQLGVELDLQLGQLTLRSRHLAALSTDLACHQDVKALFGDQTIQASLLEQAQHRQVHRLVGLGHDLHHWLTPHEETAPIPDEFDRDYDPADLAPTEKWILPIWEPVRRSFFAGPVPKEMAFLMPTKAIPADAEVAVLLGLHQVLKGPYKLIYVFRRLKTVHVYECLTHGRQFYWSLHMATDNRYCLKDGQPSAEKRILPYPDWWQNGFGKAYPRSPERFLHNNISDEDLVSSVTSRSVVIRRDAALAANLSGGVETFMPARLLFGLLPESLLDSYHFWRDQSTAPPGQTDGVIWPGYVRLRGYPKPVPANNNDNEMSQEGMFELSPSPAPSSTSSSTAQAEEFMLLIELEASARPGSVQPVAITKLPGRTVRVLRVPRQELVDEFMGREQIASALEAHGLLERPEKKKGRSAEEEEEEEENRKKKEQKPLEEGQIVEAEWQGGNEYHPARILEAHDDGTYDIQYIDQAAWIGVEKGVARECIREAETKEEDNDNPFQARKVNPEGLWHWEGMTDDEDEDWNVDSDLEEAAQSSQEQHGAAQATDSKRAKKRRLSFAQFNSLHLLREAAGGNVDLVIRAVEEFARTTRAVHGKERCEPFRTVPALLSHIRPIIRSLASSSSSAAAALSEDKSTEGGKGKAAVEQQQSSGVMLMLNLLYSPSGTRFHSLLKTLARLDTAGHILAWTDANEVRGSSSANQTGRFSWFETSGLGLLQGAPFLSLVELPRLKLTFRARTDPDGETRLYCVDHSDLYISNDRPALSSDILSGCPHSLILSNLQGELTVLMPVVLPKRPVVQSQPFTTRIVLFRGAEHTKRLSQRYFLYPVHVSLSFLMSKGLAPSLYLLLLRFLHRDYEKVYRLSDSVATDTKFTAQEQVIFEALKEAEDDYHPNAHACRAKISLVTMDSGSTLPWDLLTECYQLVVKQAHVTANCRMLPEEELQLLECDAVLRPRERAGTDDSELPHPYIQCLVDNRRNVLRALLQAGAASSDHTTIHKVATLSIAAECSVPPRHSGYAWSYYVDKTVFGQNYAQVQSVASEQEFAKALEIDAQGGPMPDGGWLVMLGFHVRWSEACKAWAPRYEDLPPLWPFVKFLSLEADTLATHTIAIRYKIKSFPCCILLRGGQEVERVQGGERAIQRTLVMLANATTTEDKRCFAQRFRKEEEARKRQEDTRGPAAQKNAELEGSDEEDENETLQWTWDPEVRGHDIDLFELGSAMQAVRRLEAGAPQVPVWETRSERDPAPREWKSLDPQTTEELEKLFVSGRLMRGGNSVQMPDGNRAYCGFLPQQYDITGDLTVGYYLSMYGMTSELRRRGPLIIPKYDPKEKQRREEAERYEAKQEQQRLMAARLKQQRKGKETQAARGSTPFTAPSDSEASENRGLGWHKWDLKWAHEPVMAGQGDAVGVCLESFEQLGPCAPPLLGGDKEGLSLGLHASGKLFHRGVLLATADLSSRPAKVQGAATENSSTVQSAAQSAQGPSLQKEEKVLPGLHERKEKERGVSGQEAKEKEPSKQTAPPVKLLWGKGDVVSCILDLRNGEGSLKFLVNGVEVDGVGVSDLRALLGENVRTAGVYPCASVYPLPDVEREGNESEEKNANESRGLDLEREKLLKDASICNIDPEILKTMPASSRAHLVSQALEARQAAAEKACVHIVLSAKEQVRRARQAAKEKHLEEKESNENQVESLTDEAESKTGKGADGDSKHSEQLVRWMHETQKGWRCYSKKSSELIESARSEGRHSVSFREDGMQILVMLRPNKVGDLIEHRDGDDGKGNRVRRQVLTDAFSAQWEVMSLKFEAPLSLRGVSALRILEKIWSKGEDMQGEKAGLGFLFLYGLLQGQLWCKIVASGGWASLFDMMEAEGGGGRASDSFRFGCLLAQLYTDHRAKSLCSSIVTVLAQNKQLCPHLPRFRDTRKIKKTAIFNGWTDLREPRSPLRDLFKSLVPALRRFRRRRNVMKFPPDPPYPELPAAVTTVPLLFNHPAGQDNEASSKMGFPLLQSGRPELTDYAASERCVRPVMFDEILKLAESMGVQLGDAQEMDAIPPVHVHSKQEFENTIQEFLAASQKKRKHASGEEKQGNGNSSGIIVVDFFATWCKPCQALEPILFALAVRSRSVRFIKVDVDECEYLPEEFDVRSIPAIVVMQNGSEVSCVKAKILGGGPPCIQELMECLERLSSQEDWAEQKEAWNVVGHVDLDRKDKSVSSKKQKEAAGHAVSTSLQTCLDTSAEQIQDLASQPLAKLARAFTNTQPRNNTGLSVVDLPFSLEDHSAAAAGVARAMLKRMRADVQVASSVKARPVAHLSALPEHILHRFFTTQATTASSASASPSESPDAMLRQAQAKIQDLIKELEAVRENDGRMVQTLMPLLTQAANYVEQADSEGVDVPSQAKEGSAKYKSSFHFRQKKLSFLLARQCGQEPEIWLQFLFSALLSSQAEQDIRRFNPYQSHKSCSLLLDLTTCIVLRANRVGHVNRCLDAAQKLQKLLTQALAIPPNQRALQAAGLRPSIIQAGQALAQQLTARRNFAKAMDSADSEENLVYDPRFLIFEFTWNILLRRNQVELVQDFMQALKKGQSKVKQMIMGAGKTTVVAPLLALMLADGKSLVLSVVPQALVEMSRKRMRETFASIMQKRISTLHFDRSTEIKNSSLRQSLENAMRNRGIVVATPTSIKSIMLAYIETLGRLRELTAGPDLQPHRVEELQLQAKELRQILALFQDGVMLLDEVDLILHPLKSELNFPMGPKFPLDVSSRGERWGLPMHLMDAMFYASSHVQLAATAEIRGTSLDILKKLKAVVEEGYKIQALQRLPHVTLLNQEYYHVHMKPLLAEWACLWLGRHHLHGLSREEALQYLLSGASARSASTALLQMLEHAVTRSAQLLRAEQDIKETQFPGQALPDLSKVVPSSAPYLTDSNDSSKPPQLVRQISSELLSDDREFRIGFLEKRHSVLEQNCKLAREQETLIQQIYQMEEEQEMKSKQAQENMEKLQHRLLETSQEIEILQFPRDDSLQNSVVVWLSHFFGDSASTVESGESRDETGAGVNSIQALIAQMEDDGCTVRRCDTSAEALARIVELGQKGYLRCVIAGGGSDTGCGPACTRDHSNTSCFHCGYSFSSHDQHMCQTDDFMQGGRGYFPSDLDFRSDWQKIWKLAKDLTSSNIVINKKPFPRSRLIVYASKDNRTLVQEKMGGFGGFGRNAARRVTPGLTAAEVSQLLYQLWAEDILAVDEGKDLLSWVKNQQSWDIEAADDRIETSPTILSPGPVAVSPFKEGSRTASVSGRSRENSKKEGSRTASLSGREMEDSKKEDEPELSITRDEEDDEDLAEFPTPLVLGKPRLSRQVSEGTTRLAFLQSQLEKLEAEKADLTEAEELRQEALQAEIAAQQSALERSLEVQLADFDAGLQLTKQIEAQLDGGPATESQDMSPGTPAAASQMPAAGSHKSKPGPHAVMHAVTALVWLACLGGPAWSSGMPRLVDGARAVQLKLQALQEQSRSLAEQKRKLERCRHALSEACGFLRRTALAVKVLAHVSLTSKKLLNLGHDWLNTFLPHCLSKVNRVSFGLLNSKQSQEALWRDPNTPRSRLKLAVPFVGKDVPATSSEFAHPDIIIGLTVLAYRYHGLRDDDFLDLVDYLTTNFSLEIGPPRERASSRRHESWVIQAGGAVRGIKKHRRQADAQPTKGKEWKENKEGEQPAANQNQKEVVQLKYLQKSNVEQMTKLYDLWRMCPQVIHYYLNKFIFPTYTQSQHRKISASGQAVGGAMLVARRLGFSGTPSDLLPIELGQCGYETGDDGKMLQTVLDPQIAHTETLPDNWDVSYLISRIAKQSNPVVHALIDTGALVTGFSNEQVAAELLRRGLEWCQGVVFLDDADKQQVLVRSTGRVVPADQCGVPLERRFAFYDQIHTTGMDIKHVVNAQAVITLGKDMVFRDYVQGAYRMREIGHGQTIAVYIIPEVAELIRRELRPVRSEPQYSDSEPSPLISADLPSSVKSLAEVVAWLVVNSMRSEQTQWNMLCLQNVANVYRKNAFKAINAALEKLIGKDTVGVPVGETKQAGLSALSPEASLEVFEEKIDFSLEKGVPDPVPFEAKLEQLLKKHQTFILTPEEHQTAEKVLKEVGEFALLDGQNKLDTEQEREQEQEQQREVQARRDQEIEVEKFVDREYARNQESPQPWNVSLLSRLPVEQASRHGNEHPFYPLAQFKLPFLEPLQVPGYMYLSRNYFNPNWTGLRRVKNVVMVLEWAPDTGNLKLVSEQERRVSRPQLTEEQRASLVKAFSFLRHHARKQEQSGNVSDNWIAGPHELTSTDVANTIRAATDRQVTEQELTGLMSRYGTRNGQAMSLDGLRNMLLEGAIFPEENGRYFVAVSLAEAETLRRILHLRSNFSPLPSHECTQFALRYSPLARLRIPNPPGEEGRKKKVTLIGDGGGVVLDASAAWRHDWETALVAESHTHDGIYKAAGASGATPHQLETAFNVFRFFDSDMHFSEPALNLLLRALQLNSPYQRERFFTATAGCRRRLAKKWQDTPLAKVLTVEDEWASLKQRGLAVFIREAIAAAGLTNFEAFTIFDADNSQNLSAPELYAALRFLKVPGVTGIDVVSLVEWTDRNADGLIDYKDFTDLITIGSGLPPKDEDEDEDEDEEADEVLEDKRRKRDTLPPKVEPYGIDELREVQVRRRKEQFELQRLERQRRSAYETALDMKLLEEELRASASRPGGANPFVSLARFATEGAVAGHEPVYQVLFRFTTQQDPLRMAPKGGAPTHPRLQEAKLKEAMNTKVKPLTCTKGHGLVEFNNPYQQCNLCRQNSVHYRCNESMSRRDTGMPMCRFLVCLPCYERHQENEQHKFTRFLDKSRFLRCGKGTSFSIQFPAFSQLGRLSRTLRNLKDGKDVASGGQPSDMGDTGDISLLSKETADGQFEESTLGQLEVYTLTLEMKMLLLPPSGQLTALLRFNPSDAMHSRRRHQASLYLDEYGRIGSLFTLHTSSPSEQLGVRLKVKAWSVVTIVVDARAGNMTTYVDGEVCMAAHDLSTADLVLWHQVVVFGGGKRAESRGGELRRFVLHNAALSHLQVAEVAKLGRENLRGPKVVLLVDNQAMPASTVSPPAPAHNPCTAPGQSPQPRPVGPIATAAAPQTKAGTQPPLHLLMQPLEKAAESWMEENPHNYCRLELMEGKDADPRSAEEGCHSYSLAGTLHAVVISLQPNVWSPGISILDVVNKERLAALGRAASLEAAPATSQTPRPDRDAVDGSFQVILYCPSKLASEQEFQLKTHDWHTLPRAHCLEDLLRHLNSRESNAI
eukprot:g75373.t1